MVEEDINLAAVGGYEWWRCSDFVDEGRSLSVK
jgi:hypothetical protein